ncbi:hypothetical protein CR205_12965 [Alteribacter lacisalsi]|uniref:CRISPR-associated protein Csh1 n=1 Tax=Alteribacter lacisalsi TaxID=2045244 RepID=A0A2W0HI14_9BACI|nr:hypothetical protein [Alteribacter lacisalsi]PYZ96612.1 hypothetical protein CR205_12965 [Alteribacter lacisalsi]
MLDLVSAFRLNDKVSNGSIHQYSWRNGFYVKLNPYQTVQEQRSEINRQLFFVDKNKVDESDVVEKNELIEWVYGKDIQSRVIKDDGNKALDTPKKKFYSTHVLSLSMKKETYEQEGVREHLSNKVWEVYKTPEKIEQEFFKNDGVLSFVKKANERKMEYYERFAYLKEYLHSEYRRNTLQVAVDFWNREWDDLLEVVADYGVDKTYVSFYLDFDDHGTFKDKDIYEWEREWYNVQKLFPSNEFNRVVEGKVMGIPLLDYTLNSKKPFFKEQTRMGGISQYLTFDEVDFQLRLMQYLDVAGNNSLKISYEGEAKNTRDSIDEITPGITYVYKRGQDKSIEYYDNNGRIKWEDIDVINVKNVLAVSWFKSKTIKNRKSLELELRQNIFGLSPNYNLHWLETDSKEISRPFKGESLLEQFYRQGSQVIYDYIYKGDKRNVGKYLRSITVPLLERKISKFHASKQMKDKLNAVEFYHFVLAVRKSVDIEGGCSEVEKILEKDFASREDSSEFKLESEEEFYYYAGQLAYYLVSLSKSKNKDYSMLENVIRASNASQVKTALRTLFETYQHRISIHHQKFKGIFSRVLAYGIDDKKRMTENYKEALIVGTMVNNIFWHGTKKEGETDSE